MASVRKDSRREALFYPVGANAAHGIRRSNADKRKAVQLLLDDPEWWQWSVNQIAETSNASGDLVEAVRKAYLPEPEDSERLLQQGEVSQSAGQDTVHLFGKGRVTIPRT